MIVASDCGHEAVLLPRHLRGELGALDEQLARHARGLAAFPASRRKDVRGAGNPPRSCGFPGSGSGSDSGLLAVLVVGVVGWRVVALARRVERERSGVVGLVIFRRIGAATEN